MTNEHTWCGLTIVSLILVTLACMVITASLHDGYKEIKHEYLKYQNSVELCSTFVDTPKELQSCIKVASKEGQK